MNIGIRLHDTAPGTLEERLAFARAQGFSCAHLALSKTLDGFTMDEAPRLLDEKLAARVKNAFAAREMECAVLGCYLSLAGGDAEERRRTLAVYRAHLRFARMVGARVVGTETPLPEGDPHSEESFAFFLDCLRPAVRAAEEEGAVLAVEPVWQHVVSTPEKAARMLEAIGSDHVQIILDPVNLLSAANADRAEEIVAGALRRLGGRVRILHMKDYRRVPGEANVRSLACGLGEMRYDGLLAFARENGIPMTLEDTLPENAAAARAHLETLAAAMEHD